MNYELTEQDIEQADSMSRWFCRSKRIQAQNWEDYLAVGQLGLVKASHDYIPQEGVKFWTYANHRVFGELRDYIRSFYVRHSKHPKPQTQAISLEQLIQSGWEPSANGLEGRTINKELCSKLLATLKPREQAIFKAYYFQDLRMLNIGKVLGYTEGRIYQIIDKTLAQLKKRALRMI